MTRLAKPLPIAVICLLVALLALLGYGLSTNAADDGLDEAVARGERPPAPALRLPELDGKGTSTLADYRGKVVVLNYWASWCDPCREESPLLQRWHERLERDGGGTVVGIDVLDVDSDARDFIREYGLSYPMLRDKGGETQPDYGVVGYPETFVIDKRGRVAALKRGPVDDAWLKATVPPLLEEQS